MPGHQGLHPHPDHLQEDLHQVLRGRQARRAQAQVLPVSDSLVLWRILNMRRFLLRFREEKKLSCFKYFRKVKLTL